MGVCIVCAQVCHEDDDHYREYIEYSSFFCDCGAKGDGTCQALVKRSPESELDKSHCGPHSTDTSSFSSRGENESMAEVRIEQQQSLNSRRDIIAMPTLSECDVEQSMQQQLMSHVPTKPHHQQQQPVQTLDSTHSGMEQQMQQRFPPPLDPSDVDTDEHTATPVNQAGISTGQQQQLGFQGEREFCDLTSTQQQQHTMQIQPLPYPTSQRSRQDYNWPTPEGQQDQWQNPSYPAEQSGVSRHELLHRPRVPLRAAISPFVLLQLWSPLTPLTHNPHLRFQQFMPGHRQQLQPSGQDTSSSLLPRPHSSSTSQAQSPSTGIADEPQPGPYTPDDHDELD